MAISVRLYVFDQNNALKRIPQRIRDALAFGEDGVPEYAGTHQRIAEVVVENEAGKPVRILDARGSFWNFDAEGKVGRDLGRLAAEAMELVLLRHNVSRT